MSLLTRYCSSVPFFTATSLILSSIGALGAYAWLTYTSRVYGQDVPTVACRVNNNDNVRDRDRRGSRWSRNDATEAEGCVPTSDDDSCCNRDYDASSADHCSCSDCMDICDERETETDPASALASTSANCGHTIPPTNAKASQENYSKSDLCSSSDPTVGPPHMEHLSLDSGISDTNMLLDLDTYSTQAYFDIKCEATGETKLAIHRGVQCANCSNCPIRGIRYRCFNCADYNLCEKCESWCLHTEDHVFVKIRVPIPPLADKRSISAKRIYPGGAREYSGSCRNQVYRDDEISNTKELSLQYYGDYKKDAAAAAAGGVDAQQQLQLRDESESRKRNSPKQQQQHGLRQTAVLNPHVLTAETALALESATHFDIPEINALYIQFRMLADSRGSGITRCAFNLCLGPLGRFSSLTIDRIFFIYDRDRDGVIGLSDFVTGMSLFCKGNHDERARAAFTGYDLKDDGRVTRDSVFAILIANYHLFTRLCKDFVSSMDDEVRANFQPAQTFQRQPTTEAAKMAAAQPSCNDLQHHNEASSCLQDSLFFGQRQKQLIPSAGETIIGTDPLSDEFFGDNSVSVRFEPLASEGDLAGSSNGAESRALKKCVAHFDQVRYSDEIQRCVDQMGHDGTQEAVESAFQNLDPEKRGFFEFEEFRKFTESDDRLLTWLSTLGSIF